MLYALDSDSLRKKVGFFFGIVVVASSRNRVDVRRDGFQLSKCWQSCDS